MKERKVQVSFRIPESLNNRLKYKADKENRPATDLFTEAIEKYLGEDLSGLCDSCHSMNPPGMTFCNYCGNVLMQRYYMLPDEEKAKVKIRMFEEAEEAMRRFDEEEERIAKEKGKNN